MAEKIILSKTDVEVYRDISANFDEDRFNSFALSVQREHAREFLGDALFYALYSDLDANGDPQTQKYIDLVDGSEYTYDGDTIEHYGLIAFLAYQWLAMNIREGDYFQADYGNIQYNDNPQDNMTKISQKQVDRINADYMSTAITYKNSVAQFLNTNSDDYSEWNGKPDNQSKSSFNIFSV